MNRMLYKTFLMGLFLLSPTLLAAQDGLSVKTVFDLYAKRERVTTVELRGNMVASYDMSLYRSITIEENSSALNTARLHLMNDKNRSDVIREVMKDGKVTSAFYQLKQKTRDGQNRYILFKEMAPNTFAIVYVEGKLNTEALTKFLKVDTSF